MIPILFPPEEQEFTTMGLGPLKEAIFCRVEEERNGIYELEMEYPVSGIRYPDIQKRCIIFAIPSPYRAAQPFRIYKITKPMDGIITVYAAHISYDLNGIPVNPFTASGIQSAMQGLKDNSAIANPFSFYSDKSTTGTFSVSVPTSCRSCLGGIEGSVLDTFRGEFLWDKFYVWLFNQRGQDSGVTIRYRKNLTDLEQEEDVEDLVTGIYPYWADQEGTLVTCNPPIVNAEGDFGFQRIKTVDLSSNFEEQPTPAQLQQAAESYISNNDIGKPKVSLKVDFVLLSQMSGYENLEILEKCDLCDTVTVQYEALGVDVTAEVVKIETNVLTERYESIEVGSIRANIAQQIADQQKEIQEKPSSTQMQNAINHTTQMITGNLGGYVALRLNEIGQPYEILIMDTTDINTAQNIWRYNQSGWGHSSNGYNGPYTIGATMDGAFNAAIITVGTMLFDRVRGGLLSLGGQGNGNGVLQIYDANNNLITTANNYQFKQQSPGNGRSITLRDGRIHMSLGDEQCAMISAFNWGNSADDPEGTTYLTNKTYLGIGRESDLNAYTSSIVVNNGLNPYNRTENVVIMESSAFLAIARFAYEAIFESPFYIKTQDGPRIWITQDNRMFVEPGLYVDGDFSVSGTKNRVVKTETYGDRLQYSYETASPYFGDIGTGKTDENGECWVFVDPVFSETIEKDSPYCVFLQKEGEGDIWVAKKDPDYFLVKGTPGLCFSWEIKAPQKGYPNQRMEEYFDLIGRNVAQDEELGQIFDLWFSEYEKEVLFTGQEIKRDFENTFLEMEELFE